MNPGPTGRMRGMAWLQIGLGGFLILSATGTHAPGWTISDPSARWRVENRGDHVILRSSDGRSWRRLSGSEIEASRSESALLPPPLESQAPVLVKVAELPASFGILTQDPPLDLDGDGNLELILTKGLSWSPTLWVYESVGNDSFALAHTITVPGEAGTVSINPMQVADGDGDGLQEILIAGRTVNNFWIRLYEQSAVNTYPTDISFEMVPLGNFWASHAEIDDLDGDNAKELSYSQQINFGYFSVNESGGNNYYKSVYSVKLGLDNVGIQAYTAGLDLNRNSRREILMGGLGGLVLFENDGNDSYKGIWNTVLPVNLTKVIDTNDIDHDGRPDFLVVGLGTYDGIFGQHLLLYEAPVTTLDFQVVWHMSFRASLWGDSTAILTDLNANGRTEIVFQITDAPVARVIAFEQTGDNAFEAIWERRDQPRPETTPLFPGLATGDLDRDGRPELYFNEYDGTAVRTMVFETRDAVAAPAGLTITLDKAIYATGDAVTATEFRLKNPGVQAALKLRIWLKVPSVGEIDLVSIGGDGSFQVPANFDTNLGPLTLFTVSSSLPRGNWEWNSRVTDPTTSALLNEDFNPFVIQ